MLYRDTLDLHGVRHSEVSDEVHRFVNDHWSGRWRLTIITGDSEVMKAIVLDTLSLYDVEPQTDPWNPGVITFLA